MPLEDLTTEQLIQIIKDQIHDNCELERVIESLGVSLYDDYGALDTGEELTKFVAALRQQLAEREEELQQVKQLLCFERGNHLDELTTLQATITRLEGALKHIAACGCRLPWGLPCWKTTGGEEWCNPCIAQQATTKE